VQVCDCNRQSEGREEDVNSSTIDFESAYRRYSRRVYSKCLHMVGNEAEAEDLTQEVFLQLFRKMDSFRGESAFTTWLYRIAVNVVLMRLRRKSLVSTSLEEVIEVGDGIISLEQVLGVPDRALTTIFDRLRLEHAVSQMPAGYKQVFLPHYVEGYGHREIARRLGLSIGTSKSQLYKARARLRQLLRGEYPQPRGSRVSHQPSRFSQVPRRSRRSSRLSIARPCVAVSGDKEVGDAATKQGRWKGGSISRFNEAAVAGGR
jgi:RNA polymerase sigma-70 factor, ECF subfamily